MLNISAGAAVRLFKADVVTLSKELSFTKASVDSSCVVSIDEGVVRGTTGGTYMKGISAFAAVALLSSPALAQVAAQPVPTASAPVAVIQPAAAENILRAGTEIPLITREELTTKKKQLRVGQRFQMEVSANVTQGGVTVIPAGTPAIGEITEVRNKGMWGKSGYIGARILSLRLGDRHVRMTGTFDDKGVTGTAGVVGAIAFVPIAGFFTTGTSAYIASGSATKGFLDEDLAFRTVAAPTPVLNVPAAPAAAAPAATPAPTAGGLVPVAMAPAH